MPRKRAVMPEKGKSPETVPVEVRTSLARRGGLLRLMRSLPGGSKSHDIARMFDAVSDPARFRILWALAQTPLCPCLLRQIEPMTNSALSYHLRLLRRAGLVATAARSNYRVYGSTQLGSRVLALAREAVP